MEDETPLHEQSPGGIAEGRAFIMKTLRSATVLAGIVLFILASYAQWRALWPFTVGFGFSVLLLWSLDRFIRAVLTPERLRANKEVKGRGINGSLIGFALVKYPLAGLLLWWIARHWDTYQIIAFLGGFMFLHLVIGMRAVSRLMMTSGKS
jgi:hypothetical protein